MEGRDISVTLFVTPVRRVHNNTTFIWRPEFNSTCCESWLVLYFMLMALQLALQVLDTVNDEPWPQVDRTLIKFRLHCILMQPWMASSKSTPTEPEVATDTAAALTLFSSGLTSSQSAHLATFQNLILEKWLWFLCMILEGKLSIGQNNSLTPHHPSKVKPNISVAPYWWAVAQPAYVIFGNMLYVGIRYGTEWIIMLWLLSCCCWSQ